MLDKKSAVINRMDNLRQQKKTRKLFGLLQFVQTVQKNTYGR